MTIIAYRDGILASDTGAWTGITLCGNVQKTTRTKTGGLVAASGDTGLCMWLLNLMHEGLPLTDPPRMEPDEQFNGLFIKSDGLVWRCNANLAWFRIDAPFHSLGRSHPFCDGAMAAGATAEEAVRLALKHTDGGGGDVQVERLCPTS